MLRGCIRALPHDHSGKLLSLFTPASTPPPFASPVHGHMIYPAGSMQEMIDKVRSRTSSYNNNARLAASEASTAIKLVYYRLFALLYYCVGGLADTIMVNSSWTKMHLQQLWRLPDRLTDDAAFRPVLSLWTSLLRCFTPMVERPAPIVIYPPCNTSALSQLPLGERSKTIVSVAQFRPEKNHELQLRAFAAAIQQGMTPHRARCHACFASC